MGVDEAITALQPVHARHAAEISISDLWVFASYVAVELMQGQAHTHSPTRGPATRNRMILGRKRRLDAVLCTPVQPALCGGRAVAISGHSCDITPACVRRDTCSGPVIEFLPGRVDVTSGGPKCPPEDRLPAW